MNRIIEVKDLTKSYDGHMAVNHISFGVEKGSLLGFLGVNGAGKTTVINMLATLLLPDEGEVTICGEKLGRDDPGIRRKIGIVYQQNCLDDILTVEENLICRGILHGATSIEAKRQCRRLSEVLKLQEIMKKRYRTLSGGQKRRCEIAAALMHTPEILFLDEPTTGLDPATRQDVWKTIAGLQKNEKMTVFLTTHYMEEAAEADQIIILDKGNIVTSGTPFELKDRYAKDKLRLYGVENDWEELGQQIREQGVRDINISDSGVVDIALQKTLQAMPILELAKPYISGFEVIQGNMDDVFLNAVGREEVR